MWIESCVSLSVPIGLSIVIWRIWKKLVELRGRNQVVAVTSFYAGAQFAAVLVSVGVAAGLDVPLVVASIAGSIPAIALLLLLAHSFPPSRRER
jgi:hypothetical protein